MTPTSSKRLFRVAAAMRKLVLPQRIRGEQLECRFAIGIEKIVVYVFLETPREEILLIEQGGALFIITLTDFWFTASTNCFSPVLHRLREGENRCGLPSFRNEGDQLGPGPAGVASTI
jgi:hypothetical protein